VVTGHKEAQAISIHNTTTGKIICSIPLASGISSLDLSPDGKMAVSINNKQLHYWDLTACGVGKSIDNIYAKVKEQNTISGFANFIDTYHESMTYVKEAKLLMHELAFNYATQADTAEAYNHFVNTYPSAMQTNEAKSKASELDFVECI